MASLTRCEGDITVGTTTQKKKKLQLATRRRKRSRKFFRETQSWYNIMRFCFPPCLMKRFPAKTGGGGGVDCYLIIIDEGGRRWPAAWISWTLERVYVYRQVLYKGCCKYSGTERHGISPSLFLRRLRYTTTAETAETTTTTIRKKGQHFSIHFVWDSFFFRGVHGPKTRNEEKRTKIFGFRGTIEVGNHWPSLHGH